MRVELLAPCCAGVREEDVDVVGGFGDFLGEPLELADLGVISGDRDRFCAGPFVRERV